MTAQVIDVGTDANDGTGDDLRTAFEKVNTNFAATFNNLSVAGYIQFPSYTTIQKNALSVSATSAGIVIFDTDLGKLCVYTGSAWKTITSTQVE